jgi:NADH-quinone oxidoreductase subunit N
MLSLSLYAMVAMNRDSVPATEAAMKYFVLGALASGLLLYGMSMIYGATGTLEITAVAERLYMGQADQTILVFGLVFLVSAWPSSWAWCPSTCGFRTSIMAHRQR